MSSAKKLAKAGRARVRREQGGRREAYVVHEGRVYASMVGRT
jgi:hypothetical protein